MNGLESPLSMQWRGDLGVRSETYHRLPIIYKGVTLASPLRLDVLVNSLVIVECKATATYHPIFEIKR